MKENLFTVSRFIVLEWKWLWCSLLCPFILINLIFVVLYGFFLVSIRDYIGSLYFILIMMFDHILKSVLHYDYFVQSICFIKVNRVHLLFLCLFLYGYLCRIGGDMVDMSILIMTGYILYHPTKTPLYGKHG